MATAKDTLKDRLAHYREIKISVIGRKSAQWYKNVLKNPSIEIDARGVEAKFRAAVVTDAKAVKSVIEKFKEKYGAADVKKYYSGFDVAVLVKLE
jgi:hypothetical protein